MTTNWITLSDGTTWDIDSLDNISDIPNLDQEERERFGVTYEEQMSRCYDHGDPQPEDEDLLTSMSEWRDQHPALNEYYRLCQERNEAASTRSFCGQNLNQPGIQIELADGSRYLIGHINPNRGVCDDCTKFPTTTVITRYRVLVTQEDLNA